MDASTHDKPIFCLLGAPSVLIDGRVISNFRSNRIAALIGLLAARARPWQREEIAAALWPDAMPTDGRHNLRQVTLFTKQLLGEHVFVGDRQSLALSVDFETDVKQLFEAADSFCPPGELILRSERAISLYKGDFLQGFEDEWIGPIRSHCAQLYVTALLTLAERFMVENPTKSLEYANRAIEAEPFLDAARVQKILALRAQGEEASAHQELKSYKNLLHDEFGIEPSQAIFDAISPSRTPELDRKETIQSDDEEHAIDSLLRSSRPKRGLELAVAKVPFWLGTSGAPHGIVVLRRALDQTERLGNCIENQIGLVALSELLSSIGKHYEAREILRKLLPEIAHSRVKLRALLTYSKMYVVAYQAKTGEPYTLQALDLAIREGSTEDQVDAYRRAAESALFLGNVEEAESLADICTELATSIGDWQAFASVWVLIATLRLRTGRTEEARQAMNVALGELADKDSNQVSNIRCRFYRLIEELGDAAEAEAGYRKSIEDCRRFDDQMGLAISLTYLGDILTTKGKLDEALQLHEEALDIRLKLQEPLGEATSLRGIGRIFLAQNQLKEAREALKGSSRIYLACEAIPGHASALLELARVAKASGEIDLALRIAKRAQQLLSAMSHLEQLTIGPSQDSYARQAERLIQSLLPQNY